MPDVLIEDLDDDLLDRLRRIAAKNGRSLESELRDILSEGAEMGSLDELQQIRRVRATTKGNETDSADLLREDRNR